MLTNGELFTGALLLACALLLAVTLFCLHRRIRSDHQKAQQLDNAMAKLEIQQILLHSYKDPECIVTALHKTADMLSADAAFLLVLHDSHIDHAYRWPQTTSDDDLSDPRLLNLFSQYEQFLTYGKALYFDADDRTAPDDAKALFAHRQTHRLLVEPVFDADHALCALLGTRNMANACREPEVLSDVADNFMLALSDMESYLEMQRMSRMDVLTGLNNRNSYQQFLSQYAANPTETLSCIYLDANGLHERNNRLGHTAGDQMLIGIAHILGDVFCEDELFRIGGDEFIVFSRSTPRKVERCIQKVSRQFHEADYTVSIGFSSQTGPQSLHQLIAEAEQKMYQAKDDYYRARGDKVEARVMNRKLEQILQQKQDADTFLSIIAPYFMGVYVVDLESDETRTIYQPTYFTSMLKKTGYKYTEALKEYIRTFVQPQEQEAFLDFMNYDVIRHKLNDGKTLEYRYTKTDGSRLFLRICQATDYGTEKKEAFWIFEKFNG